MYRNIGAAIPIDSSYTKYSLLDLHPNIFVQRSPNQIRQNAFFWAHHEKILVVDHVVAFVGGIDLCFGRWDTPQHSLRDDRPTGFDDTKGDPDTFQLWPGKDYSNPRVQDFYALDKPYEEMYDRAKVPRMPWHDISMQLVGQPARDLTRHFVQRWNYLLRQRKPSRPTPILLPPPDFTDEELQSLGIDGTCEIQILRSSCAWSMGTPHTVEQSIMNAYLKAIETSDHFIYVENQFFITSCEWEGTKIENSIGDALVERILRAYKNDEDWRAIIVIPLMPGFQNSVDSQDGTSIRLIMQCQYRSISRGESSIFGRLRAQGIEPEDFIQFYGLRNWGKVGPDDALVTEQLYIHAKCMVVDDRIAIIGSANINERSMLGNRDSEVAAIVRDTDTIMSTMAGKPYRVGKFAHSLRLRLMREHLGIDVDEIMSEERRQEMEAWEREMNQFSEMASLARPVSSLETDEQAVAPGLVDGHAETDSEPGNSHTPRVTMPTPIVKNEAFRRSEVLLSFNHDVDWEQENSPFIRSCKKESHDPRVSGSAKHKQDVEGEGPDNMKEKGAGQERSNNYMYKVRSDEEDKKGKAKAPGFTKNTLPPWEIRPQSSSSPASKQDNGKGRPRANTATTIASTTSRRTDVTSDTGGYDGLPPQPSLGRRNSADLGLPLPSQLPPLPRTNDFDIGGPPLHRPSTSSATRGDILPGIDTPYVEPDMFIDPLNDSFYLDVWHACAVNNTRIFRDVFRCMPDNEVKTWKEYKEYAAYQERFSQSMCGDKVKIRRQPEAPGRTGTSASSTGPHAVFSTINKTLHEKDRLIQGENVNDGGKPTGTHGQTSESYISRESLGSREKADNDLSFIKPPRELPNSTESLSTVHQLPASRGNDIYRSDTLRVTNNDSRSLASRGSDVLRSDTFRGTNNDGRPMTSRGSYVHRSDTLRTINTDSRPSASRGSDYHRSDTLRATNADGHPPASRGNDVHYSDTLHTTSDSSRGLDIHRSNTMRNDGRPFSSATCNTFSPTQNDNGAGNCTTQPSTRRRRRNTRSSRREFHASDDLLNKETAEMMLGEIQGHLVVWPYDWLIKAEDAGNWLYSIDQLAPIEI